MSNFFATDQLYLEGLIAAEVEMEWYVSMWDEEHGLNFASDEEPGETWRVL